MYSSNQSRIHTLFGSHVYLFIHEAINPNPLTILFPVFYPLTNYKTYTTNQHYENQYTSSDHWLCDTSPFRAKSLLGYSLIDNNWMFLFPQIILIYQIHHTVISNHWHECEKIVLPTYSRRLRSLRLTILIRNQTHTIPIILNLTPITSILEIILTALPISKISVIIGVAQIPLLVVIYLTVLVNVNQIQIHVEWHLTFNRMVAFHKNLESLILLHTTYAPLLIIIRTAY